MPWFLFVQKGEGERRGGEGSYCPIINPLAHTVRECASIINLHGCRPTLAVICCSGISTN